MRLKLSSRYPHLGSSDATLRAVSTTELLHDFVLDVGLVERFRPKSPTGRVVPSSDRSMYDPVRDVEVRLGEYEMAHLSPSSGFDFGADDQSVGLMEESRMRSARGDISR